MNTYLLGFIGGACGDFLCSQISETDSFYTVPYKHAVDLNTTHYSLSSIDPKNKIKSAYKEEHIHLNTDQVDRINGILETKNIIIPTHYHGSLLNSNIPNLIPVLLHGYLKLANLFYTLVWIKRLSMPWSGIDPYDISIISKLPQTIERPLLYSYQRLMLNFGFNSLEHCVKGYWPTYIKHAVKRNNDWRLVDTDALFLKPHSYINDFNNILNLNYTIDPEVIRQYHLANLSLIERTFNKTHLSFFSGNWLEELHQWVKEKCPQS